MNTDRIREEAEQLFPYSDLALIPEQQALRIAYTLGATRSAWVSVEEEPIDDADVICKDEEGYRCHCVFQRGRYKQVGTDNIIVPLQWQYLPI